MASEAKLAELCAVRCIYTRLSGQTYHQAEGREFDSRLPLQRTCKGRGRRRGGLSPTRIRDPLRTLRLCSQSSQGTLGELTENLPSMMVVGDGFSNAYLLRMLTS